MSNRGQDRADRRRAAGSSTGVQIRRNDSARKRARHQQEFRSDDLRSEEWFTDDCPLNADSKMMIEQIGGRWIVEMGELKGMRRGEVEHVKSTLTRRVDKARLAYGRMPVEQPRQCVFFGTTNDSGYPAT